MFEQANKWTKFSMIVTHLGTNIHNTKARIGFYNQSMNENPGHSRNTCPTTRINNNKNIRTNME